MNGVHHERDRLPLLLLVAPLQSGWLHWSSNGTARAAAGSRWQAFTRLVAEGLWSDAEWGAPGASLVPGRTPPPPPLSLHALLPLTPPELFWPEVLRALGGLGEGAPAAAAASALGGGGVRLWPGECPLLPGEVPEVDEGAAMGSPALDVVAQINAGVRHLELVSAEDSTPPRALL